MSPPLLPESDVPQPSLGARAVGVLTVLFALTCVGLTASILRSQLTGSDVTMLFLIVVVWGGLTFGRLAGVVAAVAGTLASNFFFFVPFWDFGFDTTRDAITLSVFLIVAMTTGTLAAKVREEREQQRLHAERAERLFEALNRLYQVSQRLAKATTRDEVRHLAENEIAQLLGVGITLCDEGAADWPPGRKVALNTPRGAWGHLVFSPPQSQDAAPNHELLYDAAGEQVALTLERVRLTEDMAEAKLIADGEKLRRALMNSISHDLKTPIGSIMGAASSLLLSGAKLDGDVLADQLGTILQAAGRLDRYVRNLLDNTVIEAGGLKPACDWVDLADTISVAIDASAPAMFGKQVDLILEGDLPLLWLDAVLIERVFVNLFENAAKYAPPEARIEARAALGDGKVVASVFNRTAQPPVGALDRLFEPYVRGEAGDLQKGAGLGLSICRAFMHAHGGEISAQYDSHRHGLVINLTFPITRRAPIEESMDD